MRVRSLVGEDEDVVQLAMEQRPILQVRAMRTRVQACVAIWQRLLACETSFCTKTRTCVEVAVGQAGL